MYSVVGDVGDFPLSAEWVFLQCNALHQCESFHPLMTPVPTVGCFAAGQLTESIIDPDNSGQLQWFVEVNVNAWFHMVCNSFPGPLPWRVVQDALRKEQLIEAFKTFDKARVRNADRGFIGGLGGLWIRLMSMGLGPKARRRPWPLRESHWNFAAEWRLDCFMNVHQKPSHIHVYNTI
jgi:hypothetical protein